MEVCVIKSPTREISFYSRNLITGGNLFCFVFKPLLFSTIIQLLLKKKQVLLLIIKKSQNMNEGQERVIAMNE